LCSKPLLVANASALSPDRRPLAFQRQVVEPARMRVDGAVDARELLLEHHVAALLGKPCVVRVLEGLEGAHQLAMGDHGVERNAGLGFQFRCSVDVHSRSP